MASAPTYQDDMICGCISGMLPDTCPHCQSHPRTVASCIHCQGRGYIPYPCPRCNYEANALTMRGATGRAHNSSADTTKDQAANPVRANPRRRRGH